MLIGVPKEIKNHEYRVGLVPGSVRELIAHGHSAIIETKAGSGIGFSDADYEAAGASIASAAADVFAKADMIVKVKEPQAIERKMLREGQILYTYLHLAPDPDQTKDLVDSGSVCIAYETVTSPFGGLPLLAPMSQVAGRMSIQAAAHCLEKAQGGRGVLMGGVPGVEPAKVVILGGGVVGSNAAIMATGLAADVSILDRNPMVLDQLTTRFANTAKTVYSTHDVLERLVLDADVVIGGVLVPGAAAPKLVSADLVKRMKAGSVIVDVAIDQGGCVETAHATTHSDPTYIVDDVVHYCVANMPGGVARTSTFALNNATLPFALALADKGYKQALADDPHLRMGLNVHLGKITNEPVAHDLGYDFVPPEDAMAA